MDPEAETSVVKEERHPWANASFSNSFTLYLQRHGSTASFTAVYTREGGASERGYMLRSSALAAVKCGPVADAKGVDEYKSYVALCG